MNIAKSKCFCYFLQFMLLHLICIQCFDISRFEYIYIYDFSHIGMHAELILLKRAFLYTKEKKCESRTCVVPLLLWISNNFKINADTHARTRDRDDSDFNQSLDRKKKLIYHFDDGFSAELYLNIPSGCEYVCVCVSECVCIRIVYV